MMFWCPVLGRLLAKTVLLKADKYPTSHFSPFNCCLSVVL